jgi:hypothetical protein
MLIAAGLNPYWFMIFGTPKSLQRLVSTKHVFVDGIHRCVEGNLVTTILTTREGYKSVPGAFIISDQITIDSYKDFWLHLDTKGCGGKLRPDAFLSDFEAALFSSLQEYFPKSAVWG